MPWKTWKRMSKPYEELDYDDMVKVSNAGPIIALARIGRLQICISKEV